MQCNGDRDGEHQRARLPLPPGHRRVRSGSSGQTQFGRRRDDWGNWFGNNNPTWLWHYTIADRYLRRNPQLAVKSVRRSARAIIRTRRASFRSASRRSASTSRSRSDHVTSACSPAPYRDELFGPDFATSVFISEPVHNVVHREVLGPTASTFTSRARRR